MIICFDLETTGLDKYNDKIIEVALVKFDENTFEVIDKFVSFIDPEILIPDLISNITNIYDSDVEGAPKIRELKDEIINFIGNCKILGHNISFDIDFFKNSGIDLSENIHIDTFFLSNFLSLDSRSLNLEVLCDNYGISHKGAHRALNDTLATINLFEKLLNKFKKLTKIKKQLLFYIFNKSEDKNIEFLRDYLFKTDSVGLSFLDFEKQLLKKIGKVDKDIDFIVDNKIKNSNISKIYNNISKLDKRENQLKMTEVIMDSFTSKKKLVIEAPTGLGKSFAYLIPSIISSLKTGEKVYVSTKTKALQDQLYFKDLKFLLENLGLNFRYTKLKGKNNYLSVKLFLDEVYNNELNYTKIGFLSKIILWLFDTKYGELDELNFYGQEFVFIKYMNADNYEVISEKNDYKNYEFLFKARLGIETSNLIIVNHSLLFSDLNTETPILGNINNLIIDEGHNIEDSVTDSLKKKYSFNNLNEVFSIIENIYIKINGKKIDFIRFKEKLNSELEFLDDYAFNYLNLITTDNDNKKQILMNMDFYNDSNFTNLIKKIELNFLDIIDKLSIESEYNFKKEIVLLQGYLDTIKIILDKNSSKEYIKILNYNNKYGITFEYTLLNPGDYLLNNLWSKLNTCILTSATLKISGTFDYFKKILFLNDFDFLSFESDFDYKKQATLFIPTDLGNIKSNSNNIVNFLGRFFGIVRGKVLTLLTSYSIIKKIYTNVNHDLKANGINLYAQGIAGSKLKLMSFYLKDPSNSILLGTDSFWEGIDIPGDDLKYLIIHKFPFSVPTDPIFQARSVFFKDPFLDYSIPKAIIKLKQGFGRLIRTKNDSGIVILLDNRIYDTYWGNSFLDAFPSDINIKKGSSNLFLEILSNKI